MRVHDTELLVARAQEHRRVEGRIERGTYGYTTDPDDKRGDGFRGCQIACLSTPAVPVEMAKFLDKLRGDAGYDKGIAFGLESAGLRPEEQVEKIERQFGIMATITRMGENAFERSFGRMPNSNERAADFVLAYAEAFHEDAEFDLEMVARFAAQLGMSIETPQYADDLLTWIDGTKPGVRSRRIGRRILDGFATAGTSNHIVSGYRNPEYADEVTRSLID